MVSSTNLRENRDLKRPPTYRVAFGRTLGCTDERDRHAQNKQYVTPKQHKKKGPQKPTLIRNLGSSGIPKVVGKMVYDPVSQIWKGNERELDVFEQSNQSSTPTRPSLIPHISTLNTPMTVGRMKFDPVKMCWTGNEEDEEDAHLFDDIESFEIQQETKTEYVLDKSVKESFLLSEANHKLLMGQWYPRVVGENRSVLRDSSKTFLYEIRSIRC
ncbi:hypothetical protein BC833DRAFT_31727 [Globomyces pollinis-pini]|nr:hypothetical protein BC833DRAFT_31727 [Globomyces pollinis-pini]